MIETDIKAIPTDYRGFTLRSRLEAKWASFFDLCGWQWSYEPFDLDGWIPDFAIGEWPIACEVKPYFQREQWDAVTEKVASSGCRDAVLLLGADPVWRAANADDAVPVCHAMIPQYGENGFLGHTVEDVHFGLTQGNGKPGLCPMYGGWTNLVWRAMEGKAAKVDLRQSQVDEELLERWAKACNVTQWFPVREVAHG